MSIDINLVLIMSVYCFGTILSFAEDWVFIKRRLRDYEPIVAEVIYFDEVSVIKGISNVTIVSYKSNGLQKDAVILKAKKDKIGDKIEIVTDGKIAVRKKIALKEDQHFGVSIFALGIILFFLKYSGSDEGGMTAVYFMFIMEVIFAIFYPVIYEAFDSEVKEKLGWRK